VGVEARTKANAAARSPRLERKTFANSWPRLYLQRKSVWRHRLVSSNKIERLALTGHRLASDPVARWNSSVENELSPADELGLSATSLAELASRLAADAAEVAAHPEASSAIPLLQPANEATVLSDRMLAAAVRHERLIGSSWAAIGSALGMNRETARLRFSSQDASEADPRWLW
jgi:hypothetical protein